MRQQRSFNSPHRTGGSPGRRRYADDGVESVGLDTVQCDDDHRQPASLRSNVVDSMRSSGIVERLNNLVPVAVIDDGDTRMGSSFEGRERVLSASGRPLMSSDGRRLAGRAEGDQVEGERPRIHDRQLRR